jgi:hypothetical protein
VSPALNTVFRLDGEQTVRTIAETHQALAGQYANADSLTIDPTGLVDADLTLVQLIESLRRSAAQDNKRVCMSGPLPSALQTILVRGGFLSTPDANLFWTAP